MNDQTNPPTGTPGAGHNSGLDPILNPTVQQAQWEIDHREMFARRDELLGSVARFWTKYPKIEDEAAQETATELVSQMKATAKQAETVRGTVGAPFLALTRAVNAIFKTATHDRLEGEWQKIERAQSAYAIAKEERLRKAAEAEAKRLREEAEVARLAAERVRKEEEAAQQQSPISSLFGLPSADPNTPSSAADELERDVAMAEAQAAQAQKTAAAPSKDLGRTRTALGAVASLVDNWTFELVDITKVPKKYLLLNEQLVRAEVRSLKGAAEIPGVRVYNDKKVRSNAR